MTNPLSRRSIMLHLHIRKWDAEVSDKQALQLVAASTGANTKKDKYKKSLFVTDALQAVNKAAGRIRTFFYHETMPWADGGGRIIPSIFFQDYAKHHKKLVYEFDTAVARFLEKYPEHIEQAREHKGDLFHESEYPPVQALRDKFAVELITLPFPDIRDFRVEAAEDVIDEMKRNMAESINSINHSLEEKIKTQIVKRLNILLESLSSGKTFKKTIFEELDHALSFAEGFGELVSAEISTMVRNTRENVLAASPEKVRDSESLKSKVIHNIKEVLKDV